MTRTPSGPSARAAAGLSLIELLAVVAILAVTIAAAGPALATVASTSRLDAASAQLHAALRLARSEAMKRGALVGIEPVDARGWAGELRVYADADGDPSDGMQAGDTLVRQFGRSRSVTQASGAPARIAIDARGRNVSLEAQPRPVATRLALCTPQGARRLDIEPGGALAVTPLAEGC
jgi:prepilin-type N-terminal cleavage/methylation domain-containing protein